MTDQTPPTEVASIPPSAEPGSPMSFWARWGEMGVAIGVLIVGIVVLVETQDIRVRQGVVVSPRTIPTIVGIGLILVSLWYAIDIIRAPHRGTGDGDAEDVDPEATTDWVVILTISLALVLYAALIDTAGFVIASTVLFFVSTIAMHSRAFVRNAAIGLLLSIGVYLLFDGWLGVRLPGGWFEDLLNL